MDKKLKNGIIKIAIGIFFWIPPLLIRVSEFTENHSNFQIISHFTFYSMVLKILGSLAILMGLSDILIKNRLRRNRDDEVDLVQKNKHPGLKFFWAIVFGVITWILASASSYQLYTKYWIFFFLSIFMVILAFIDLKSKKGVKILAMFFIAIIYVIFWFVCSLKTWHW